MTSAYEIEDFSIKGYEVKYKVGDRVRINSDNRDYYNGKVGTVIDVWGNTEDDEFFSGVKVSFEDNFEFYSFYEISLDTKLHRVMYDS